MTFAPFSDNSFGQLFSREKAGTESMSCNNQDRDFDLSRKCEKILLQIKKKHTERH